MDELLDTILLGGVPPQSVLDWFGINFKMLDEIRGYNDLQPVPRNRYDNYPWLYNACKGRKRMTGKELLKKSGFNKTPISFGYYMKKLDVGGFTKFKMEQGVAWRIDEAKLKEWFEAK